MQNKKTGTLLSHSAMKNKNGEANHSCKTLKPFVNGGETVPGTTQKKKQLHLWSNSLPSF